MANLLPANNNNQKTHRIKTNPPSDDVTVFYTTPIGVSSPRLQDIAGDPGEPLGAIAVGKFTVPKLAGTTGVPTEFAVSPVDDFSPGAGWQAPNNGAISREAVPPALTSATDSGTEFTVTFSYATATAEDASRLQDQASNGVAFTADQTSTNNTRSPPLTASVSENPSTHDGSATITFKLRISEELNISQKTWKTMPSP